MATHRHSAHFPVAISSGCSQHFFTHARYPTAGLGAHASCRNPGGVNAFPWCYTTDPRLRWERCDVAPPSVSGCSERKQHHTPAKQRGPSACERTCPHSYALVLAGDCEAADECSSSCEGPSCRFLLRDAVGDSEGVLVDVDGNEDDTADAEPSGGGSSYSSNDSGADHSDSGGINDASHHPIGADQICAAERATCVKRRTTHERLQLVLWISLAGTSGFVLSLVWYAYRLTSPLGSPRSWAAAGYHGLPFASPLPHVVDDASPRQERWAVEQELRDLRQKELLDAECAVLFE